MNEHSTCQREVESPKMALAETVGRELWKVCYWKRLYVLLIKCAYAGLIFLLMFFSVYTASYCLISEVTVLRK